MKAQKVDLAKSSEEPSSNSKLGLKKSMKSTSVQEHVRLQPLKDSRPVSSLSFTGSATSRDSGCSFGEQPSPVNFTCGDTQTRPETPFLPEECTGSDFLPLSASTIQSFFSASNSLADLSSCNTLNNEGHHHQHTNQDSIVGQQHEDNVRLQMHHHRAQARQQGILANSNSSPCLFDSASPSAIAAAIANKQQQTVQKHGGDDPTATPMLHQRGLKGVASQQSSQINSKKTMSAATSFSNLIQYINPEIHNVRAPSAVLQDKNLNTCATKNHRQDAYKTVMCQAWLESTKCSFGDNCKFAHGEAELRPARIQPRNNTKYKTKLCDKYTTTGICPYGSRCLFIHPPTKTSPMSGEKNASPDSSFNNDTSAMANSAKLRNKLNRVEGLPNRQSPPNRCEPSRKQFAPTSSNQKHHQSNSNYANPNFPPLPNAYSMPSVFSGEQQHGFRTNKFANVHKDRPEEMAAMERPSAWGQASSGLANAREKGSQDGLLTTSGGRPHPSWPLEPAKFFKDVRRSSCVEHFLTAPNLEDFAIDKEEMDSKQLKDRFGYQARNFDSRSHHQSMPMFNMSTSFQQHLPNSRKTSRASCGEPPAVEDLEEYPVLPTMQAAIQRSSTQMTIPANKTPSPSNFRPLKKRFSNGVLHSVTPHSHYSSQSSCNSCSTAASICLGGSVGRDILAEIWSSSVDSNSPDEEEEYTAFGEGSETDLEIPLCLAETTHTATPLYSRNRHVLERDMTLTANDAPRPSDHTIPMGQLSRQMEMQKLEDFFTASSENCVHPTLKDLQDRPSSNFANVRQRNSPVNMVFEEFTDFDEIPALN